MDPSKFIILEPALHRMFRDKKPSNVIKKFYKESNSTDSLNSKEDDLQMLLCYAVHYEHFQYIEDELKGNGDDDYDPYSKYKPLITAVVERKTKQVERLMKHKSSDPDLCGYGIIDNQHRLYVGKKTSALTETLKADDTKLVEIMLHICSGEIHGLLAMAQQHKAENCIKFINDRLEQLSDLGRPRKENPRVHHVDGWSGNYLDLLLCISQSYNGVVTELQQRSAWYLWTVAIKEFPVPSEDKDRFLCHHNRLQIKQLLSDESEQEKVLKMQMMTPVIHASFPAQCTDESCKSLHARVILNCLNRYLYNLKCPVQSDSFTLLTKLMKGILFCGQSATGRHTSLVEASMKFLNIIFHLLHKYDISPQYSDQDDKAIQRHVEELCQITCQINITSMSTYLELETMTFMCMLAMSGYAKHITPKQIIDVTKKCSLKTVKILVPFLHTYMNGLSKEQLRDFYSYIKLCIQMTTAKKYAAKRKWKKQRRETWSMHIKRQKNILKQQHNLIKRWDETQQLIQTLQKTLERQRRLSEWKIHKHQHTLDICRVVQNINPLLLTCFIPVLRLLHENACRYA